MIEQQIYDSMLSRRSGPGIQFETSFINMEESKELTTNNQPKKCNKSGAGVDPSSTHELIQRISLLDLKLESPKIGLGDGSI